MNSVYKEQVRLLLRILPVIYKEKDFAVHGGTAINLFVKNMLRYSVDVDLTYIPLEDRETSLQNISAKLKNVASGVAQAIPGIKIKTVPNKLLCTLGTITVKIEVNAIQRGIIGNLIELPLCSKAQTDFELFCKAHIVSISQLYGGKLGAALNRQHPRDLFDCKYMDICNFEDIKSGLFYNILGSPKPIVEMLFPGQVNQKEALENQFYGMTDMAFTYDDYEQTRNNIAIFVNSSLTQSDKDFLISYEEGCPLRSKHEYEKFLSYPSIQWKQLNINKLKKDNPVKHRQGVEKLRRYLATFENR
jgi:hypothetical protein